MGKPSKSQVLQAIEGSGGIVSQIARKLDVAWHTANSYIHLWDETKQAYDDEENRVLDLAESQLLQAIKNGDVAEAKWFLSRKGRHRGYKTGQEIDHTSKGDKIQGSPIIISNPEGPAPDEL